VKFANKYAAFYKYFCRILAPIEGAKR